jgi:hypothetical protein
MAGEEAIIVHIKQKRIIRKFRDQCATAPRQAATLEALKIRAGGICRCLIKNKVLVSAGDDKYYLDEEAADRYFSRKRRIAFIMLIVAIIVFAVTIFMK